MKRDLNKLSDQKFDVLVIGGGITGSCIALKAAQYGLRTALIEKGDFGEATSANSLKILHGGLRYLQNFDIRRMRASISSRNWFMRMAPSMIEPLACAVPTYGFGLRGRHAMRLALAANDAIGWDRNRGIPESRRLPRGRILRRGDVDPWLRDGSKRSVSGAALWYDGLALNTERLLLTLVKKAHVSGVCLANYLEAEEVRISGRRVCGVEAVDRISGGFITIHSKAVINAAGPWIESVLPAPAARVPSPFGWTLALNLITPRRLTGPTAIGLEGPGGESQRRPSKRFFFFVPWCGYTMIGTRYLRYEGRPGEAAATRREIEAFLDELNAVHPAVRLKWEDVSFYHAGILPATEAAAGGRL